MRLPTSSKYWSEAEGRVVIEAWRRSGEPAPVFARRHGLQPKRIKYWADRLSQAEDAAPPLALVPATVVGTELTAVIRMGEVTIELSSAMPEQIGSMCAAPGRAARRADPIAGIGAGAVGYGGCFLETRIKVLCALACVTFECATHEAIEMSTEEQAAWNDDGEAPGEVIEVEGELNPNWEGPDQGAPANTYPGEPSGGGGGGNGGAGPGAGGGGGPGKQPIRKECGPSRDTRSVTRAATTITTMSTGGSAGASRTITSGESAGKRPPRRWATASEVAHRRP
jgi:hypothetical protein